MPTRAFIAGLSGPVLTADEQAFFRDAEPWGFILFRRNVETPDQVRALTGALREAVGRDAPILIDQEGGRVQRLGPPHWPKYPPGRAFGTWRSNDPQAQRELARAGARLIAHDLKKLGIDVDCLPVLDVPVPGAHGIIGDRAYADDPATIAVLGRAAAEGLLAGGVLPVIKHIPGHGRARADSHEALPVVDAGLEELRARDFFPFTVLADMPLAMTAHVVYSALDTESPATTSSRVIGEIVRDWIGFEGLLMSDDLSMRALSGSMADRTAASLAAGCDVVLHCNGLMHELVEVAAAAPVLGGRPAERAAAALSRILKVVEPFDPVEARARLDAALAAVA
ncbi:beta-N-acetylhexosaminidase [Chelatococcus reniformis]|uniref:beta-N-acetylhexosaminidase n=1 Tax=Chelatococcus reniformis TaxID=1494448 RepID=A0A916XGR0_9HYPH|nr:beta-N-acetylhexosaminidase [Chelatococcus reniformis]GGC69314.1 beta-hexosaminidase [Chelatococcus reniformis]